MTLDDYESAAALYRAGMPLFAIIWGVLALYCGLASLSDAKVHR